MNNFVVRVWDGKNQQMIYSGECFEWTISLCGEVFRENKRQEDCKVMLFTGVCDVKGDEIYEGDIVSADYDGPRRNRSRVVLKDGEFSFTIQGYTFPVSKENVGYFALNVVDNIYEKAKRKAKK